ncbi:MAG: potassium-transporting ATPase subunit KdpA [Alphaproteobacteria bacterium]|nr:potassium-transporting ATPase subunit KdpA [Alphaproteobacteria bacterium]
MNTELLGIIAFYIILILLAIPLGKFMSKIYSGTPHFSDKICNPLENLIYKLIAINPKENQGWKEQLKIFLAINFVWLIVSVLILKNMAYLPLNPNHSPSMSWDLAWNTTISFVCNTNLQHYAGETQLSYLGQITLMLWQFLSAASGIAIAMVVIRSFAKSANPQLGNFYVSFVRSITRILLPICIILAIVFMFQGVPMTFLGSETTTTLSGDTINVYRGPMAAFEPIKQLGTNGGGYFKSNGAHPFSNPTYLTNLLQNLAIIIIPLAFVIMIGYYIQNPKFARMVIIVMSVGYIGLLIPSLYQETQANPATYPLNINNQLGNLEGKEIRNGSLASANWSVATTATSSGSTNAVQDSNLPITGMNLLLGMMINAFYGGVGVGFLNFYCYIILAVFIGGLMVGRTPEFLGKKIEPYQMKVTMLVVLLQPLLILLFTGISTYLYVSNPELFGGWLTNTGFHGFSEMLYQYTSASANNGSSFEGLNGNTPFWNYTTAFVIFLSRYLLIIGPIVIAGSLAKKKYISASSGTLPTDNLSFAALLYIVIFILCALIFFPVLILGPISEYFSLIKP